MLRLFGTLVRLAFGLQIAIILFIAMGIALLNEAVSVRQAQQPRRRHAHTQAPPSRAAQRFSFR
jgi:hypothetical protein